MTVKLDDAWETVLATSVILSGPHEGRPYKTEDFLVGLEEALEGKVGDHVLAFGPLNKNQEWHLTLNNPDSKDKLLLAGFITAKGKIFKIRSSDNRRFTARIHWAPPFAPNAAILKALQPYGEVQSINFERSKCLGFESVCTGIRTVVMTGDRRKVPHLINVTNPITSDRYELLVTIAGRPPLCLKCRQTGHYRRACKTPFCRHHGVYGHTTESCALDKATYATAMRNKKDDTDDTDSDDDEMTPRDPDERNATEPAVRDPVSRALSRACRTVAQDNALNERVKKAVWAMTDEERLAFRKAYKDMEKFVKTQHVYRPPPLATVRDKAPRTVAPVLVQAEVPGALPGTETVGDNSGPDIVDPPRLAEVDVATAATPGTGVASVVTLPVSAPPSVVGVILTPPTAEAVAESAPAKPLPDHSCSSGTLSVRPAQLLSSARNRSGANGASHSSDDTSSDEEPLPQWKLVKSKRRKKRKNTEMSPSNTVSDNSPKSGCLVIVTDSSFETF